MEGLTIFNTETLCVETWNGTVWISPCTETLTTYSVTYSGNGGTPASQIGTPQADGTPFVNPPTIPTRTGYTLAGWNTAADGSGTTYTVGTTQITSNVTVYAQWVENLSADITTFTSVMYDFQKQTLEAYTTSGTATNYVWEYSDDNNVTFKPVPIPVNSAFYTVPVGFANTYLAGGVKSKEINFRCTLSNSVSSAFTPTLNILFINTTTAGYGTDANGVKYLTLNRAGTDLKVALLNLGQSDGNDAGDLGDFYQWGRVADGHQQIGWSKNPSTHANIISAASGTVDGSVTSVVIPYSSIATSAVTAAAQYDEYTPNNTTPFHQVKSGTDGYGKFISASSADGNYLWYNPNYDINYNPYYDVIGSDNYLWGQSNQDYISNRYPVSTGNDPCPTGWKVPSRWEISDLFSGNGSDAPTEVSWGACVNNNWVWRESSGTGSTVVGGAIAINKTTNEIMFLPASGYRDYSTGALDLIGINGLYWSSTYANTSRVACDLNFNSGFVSGGASNHNKTYGYSVRCVQEVPPTIPDEQPSWGDNKWVGAFWKDNETGERIIASTNASNWSVVIDDPSGTGLWLTLDDGGSYDPALWTAAPHNAENYQLPLVRRTEILDKTGDILFRIGARSTNPASTSSDFKYPNGSDGKAPRYATLTLTVGGTNYKLYCRQGEAADFVFTTAENYSNYSGDNGTRTKAKKFSPYNLTGATLNETNNLAYSVGVRGGSFVDYPTKAGAFFQWASTDNPTYAYHPTNAAATTGWSASYPTNWWNPLSTSHETCPNGWRRPNDGATGAAVDIINISDANIINSEMRQSLYLEPQRGITSSVDGSAWGYYADGYFDRLPITYQMSSYPNTTVSPNTKDVAYIGRLFFNAANGNRSLFAPAAGYRDIISNGLLYYAGNLGYYWSSSARTTDGGWHLGFSEGVAREGNNNRDGGFTVRCVDDAVVTPPAPAPASITTYTNVMYDFQHQELEAYGYGAATTFQWQYSTNGGTTWTNIASATSSKYTIPANTYTTSSFGDTHKANILFQCLTNGTEAVDGIQLDMLFIKTNTGGYGTDANGVKYLTLNKAGTDLKVALLNLGQSDGNDAGDLGDFYQWGRVADGHQKTTWSKDAYHYNQILPMNGSATSAVVARNTSTATYAANGQLTTGGAYNQSFIANLSSSGDWGTQDTPSNSRWGNGTNNRANENSSWTYPANNPCPSGWIVPNRYKFWDIFNGDGSNEPVTFNDSWTSGTGTDNNWVWRAELNNAIGGALITNTTTNEILFLPAQGYRYDGDGALGSIGDYGGYWSSTYTSTLGAYRLHFDNGYVRAGNYNYNKAYGFSVRCVEEAAPTASITTYTNVMYDFQHQELEAYGYGAATTFQWQYSTNGGTTWTDIAGAISSKYTIPAKTYTTSSFGDAHKATVIFQCLTNGTDAASDKTMNMLFIKTTDDLGNYLAGYGEQGGVKYLALGIGSGGQTVAGGSTATMKVALLNLGQSATWNGVSQTVTTLPPVYTPNNDAGDLGDFYQWGRVADGHQQIGWSKDPSTHANIISATSGTVDGRITSAVIPYSSLASNAVTAADNYDNYTRSNTTPFHQVKSGKAGYGKFISAGSTAATGYYQWYNPNYDNNPNDNWLWGESTQYTTNHYPVRNGNDPCPLGWKVPSRWAQCDLFNGDGSLAYLAFTGDWTGAGTGPNNNWVWRAAANNAEGGAVVTNAAGAILFLPAVGGRYSDGAFRNSGMIGGVYRSSTVTTNPPGFAYNARIRRTGIDPGSFSAFDMSQAFSLRCVEN
jgi:uncharacterized protein (TIGR02145 family)/uncharacterized repeat protein (TIGR02543 family)